MLNQNKIAYIIISHFKKKQSFNDILLNINSRDNMLKNKK
jgi:hypothetical protein